MGEIIDTTANLMHFFYPLIAATAVNLVIYSNFDRKLTLLRVTLNSKLSVSQLTLQQEIRSCLQLIRYYKFITMNFAWTLFFLSLIICTVGSLIVNDNSENIKEIPAIAMLVGAIGNLVIFGYIIINLQTVYDQIHNNIHSKNSDEYLILQ